jgi:hypothetical protein
LDARDNKKIGQCCCEGGGYGMVIVGDLSAFLYCLKNNGHFSFEYFINQIHFHMTKLTQK